MSDYVTLRVNHDGKATDTDGNTYQTSKEFAGADVTFKKVRKRVRRAPKPPQEEVPNTEGE